MPGARPGHHSLGSDHAAPAAPAAAQRGRGAGADANTGTGLKIMFNFHGSYSLSKSYEAYNYEFASRASKPSPEQFESRLLLEFGGPFLSCAYK